MKDPEIELRDEEKVVLKATLWTLILLHFYESENIPEDVNKLRLFLDGEEVEKEEYLE